MIRYNMTVRKSVIVLSRRLAQMQKSLYSCQLALKYWASYQPVLNTTDIFIVICSKCSLAVYSLVKRWISLKFCNSWVSCKLAQCNSNRRDSNNVQQCAFLHLKNFRLNCIISYADLVQRKSLLKIHSGSGVFLAVPL